uniref:Lipopolysaccharide-induced tumor necrosis factor-alpha factor homolog n=1 Tax=Petromyzon marinus TaxID=7757 RepID=A0AAJ7UM76_PETMA|nr:lipopolysaccharide-induced tumor necrosis factor-alpha factor homolog [Petromyzon marinus]
MTYPTQTFVTQPQACTQVPVVPVMMQQQQQPLRSSSPVRITCPYCHDEVTTKTKRRAGAYAWSAVGIIFLTGWFFILPWLFCWIPLCIPSFQDVHHKCPNCKAHLYTHSPM